MAKKRVKSKLRKRYEELLDVSRMLKTRLIMYTILMTILLSPILLLVKEREDRSMVTQTALIEPIDINAVYSGLEDIPYEIKPVDFVDVKAYLKDLDERIAAEEKAAEEKAAEERRIKDENSKWEWYDQLKPTDYIENPFYYDVSYILTPYERDLIERTVMHEAGWCPDYRLLILTAQCFRNDCEIYNWTPSEVYSKCGYAAMGYANPRARKAVSDVFDKGIKCVEEPIHCYYNSTIVSSPYHEQFNLAIDIDGNRFFY